MHQDTIIALWLNNWLSDAKLIDALTQALDGLRQRTFDVGRLLEPIRIHPEQERSASLQVNPETNAASRFPLQTVQDVSIRVQLGFGVKKWKVAREIVRPDGVLEVAIGPHRVRLLQCLDALNNLREVGIAVDRPLAKNLHQVAVVRRIKLVNGPNQHQQDQDKFREIIAIHESKLRFTGFAAALRDFRHSRFGDLEFGVGRANGKGLFFDGDDDGDHAAGGDDFIAGPNRL